MSNGPARERLREDLIRINGGIPLPDMQEREADRIMEDLDAYLDARLAERMAEDKMHDPDSVNDKREIARLERNNGVLRRSLAKQDAAWKAIRDMLGVGPTESVVDAIEKRLAKSARRPEPLDPRIIEQFTSPPHRPGQPTERQREAIERSIARAESGAPAVAGEEVRARFATSPPSPEPDRDALGRACHAAFWLEHEDSRHLPQAKWESLAESGKEHHRVAGERLFAMGRESTRSVVNGLRKSYDLQSGRLKELERELAEASDRSAAERAARHVIGNERDGCRDELAELRTTAQRLIRERDAAMLVVTAARGMIREIGAFDALTFTAPAAEAERLAVPCARPGCGHPYGQHFAGKVAACSDDCTCPGFVSPSQAAEDAKGEKLSAPCARPGCGHPYGQHFEGEIAACGIADGECTCDGFVEPAQST